MLATILAISRGRPCERCAAVASAHAPGGFGVQCGFTHMSMDDPIVYPSQPGMGHMHAFYGNKSTDAYSTRKNLLAAGTTCTDKKDKAAIWAPTAFIRKNGTWRPLEPYRERTCTSGRSVNRSRPSRACRPTSN